MISDDLIGGTLGGAAFFLTPHGARLAFFHVLSANPRYAFPNKKQNVRQ
jgi:hypothetical protein